MKLTVKVVFKKRHYYNLEFLSKAPTNKLGCSNLDPEGAGRKYKISSAGTDIDLALQCTISIAG